MQPGNVNAPTPTRLGTVLLPFQDMRGRAFVVELSRRQWVDLADSMLECFNRIDREAEFGRQILAIDREDSVT